MDYELYISLRYLKAKRKQRFISVITFISIAAVMTGVMAMVVVLSVMAGFETDLKSKILGTNAHIVVLRYGSGLPNYADTANVVGAMPGVVSATPFIFNQAMLSSNTNVAGVVLRGIDPRTSGKVISLEGNIVEGSVRELEAKHTAKDEEGEEIEYPGIIVGKELAKQLNCITGDIVRVISPLGKAGPMGFMPRMKSFKIVGIFDSGMYEYDSSLAYVTIPMAQKFFDMEDTVTGVEVKVKDIDEAPRIAKRITQKLGYPFYTRDYLEMNRNLFSALKLEKIVMFIILVLMIVVAALGIVSTLIMMVMEKTKDIAILKSMGATRNGIMRIFVFEGMAIGVIGTVLGIAAGYTLCILLNHYQFIKLPGDVYYISTIPVRMSIFDFVLISLSSLGTCLIATLYPSYNASRLPPAEALRYE